jgi:hypothetical protein
MSRFQRHAFAPTAAESRESAGNGGGCTALVENRGRFAWEEVRGSAVGGGNDKQSLANIGRQPHHDTKGDLRLHSLCLRWYQSVAGREKELPASSR